MSPQRLRSEGPDGPDAPDGPGTPHPPDPGDLVATSSSVDPSSFWARSAGALAEAADRGVLVAGRERLLAATGVAAWLPLPRGLEDRRALSAVRPWLAAVEHVVTDTGEPAERAPGPIALGAFAFDRGAPARLVVPSVTWCRDSDGRTWRVEVRRRAGGCIARSAQEGSDGADAQDRGDRRGTAVPEAVHLDQVPPPGDYAAAVARAVADIRAGHLAKVVLARMVDVRLPVPAAPSRVLDALWGGDRVFSPFSPFSVPTPAGRLVGASPELVVSRRGRTITSHALAGTVPLSAPDAEEDADRLFDSEKDRAEHRLVVDEIVRALRPRCATLAVPAVPTVVRLGSDARLGTFVRGTLASTGPEGATALSLLALLHPTPAVGGVAREAALERIAWLEPAPRGYWAGVVGWTDRFGDGEWVLGIRSVEMDGRRVLVRAGAGIVAASDPEAELAETTVKLRPVLDAVWPGASALL